MVSRELIAEVEAAGYACWPARETLSYDGWELRYADGFSGRANSVLPVGESSLSLETKLRFCHEWFDRRGVRLEVRCTPLCEPGIDDELAARGYAIDRPTHVMVGDLDGSAASRWDRIGTTPDGRWCQAMSRLLSIGEERRPGWEGIIERIALPAAHVLVANGDDEVAGGLGVVDGPWLGLFEIVVAPGWRRRGYGREVTRSLLAWGRKSGARRAFLQVVASNAPAIALYETLGFQRVYSYWYRRPPQDAAINSPA
jgi:ribosomal protein S18 acetylase RimI-like enzyme